MEEQERLQKIADHLNEVLELLSLRSNYRLTVEGVRIDGRHNFAIPDGISIPTAKDGIVSWSPRLDHNMGFHG